MNEHLRYYYHDGVVELIEHDPLTRQPLTWPEEASLCHQCGGCGCKGHYVTPEGGVWGVSEENLKKHLAMKKQRKTQKHYYDYLIIIVTFWMSFAISVSFVIMGYMIMDWGSIPTNVILVPSLFIAVICSLIHFGYCAEKNREQSGKMFPPRPSWKWEDYLEEIPELDFPVPS